MCVSVSLCMSVCVCVSARACSGGGGLGRGLSSWQGELIASDPKDPNSRILVYDIHRL